MALIGNNLNHTEEEEKRREVEEKEAESICKECGIYWAGECKLKDCSQNDLNDILIL